MFNSWTPMFYLCYTYQRHARTSTCFRFVSRSIFWMNSFYISVLCLVPSRFSVVDLVMYQIILYTSSDYVWNGIGIDCYFKNLIFYICIFTFEGHEVVCSMSIILSKLISLLGETQSQQMFSHAFNVLCTHDCNCYYPFFTYLI